MIEPEFKEKALVDELVNIVRNEPVFPGDTISHGTANKLVALGCAKRDKNSGFVTTDKSKPKLKQLLDAGMVPRWAFRSAMKAVNHA
jgi:hypothetical protein